MPRAAFGKRATRSFERLEIKRTQAQASRAGRAVAEQLATGEIAIAARVVAHREVATAMLEERLRIRRGALGIYFCW